MYLKSLEINGFKSFAKKTKLDFKSKISGIVGPNGSGKSNVAESFRFVLGEQSMKSMRGKKGEDLIFSGNNSRLNRGSIKVIFDNSDKKLKIDYNEVILERVVYRDGNNEYYINATKVRAKDVLELLTSANIGSSGHHIISQGEADKILSISSKERKSVIEEALGLKAFVIKKQESERKLERTDENLKEVKTRERVNTPRIKFLKKEVEKIEKSKELKKELKRLYELFLPEKKDVLFKIKKINDLKKETESEKRKIQEKVSKKQSELYQSKNSERTDSDKNNEVLKIKKEIISLEKEKNVLEKDFARNEIFIENELKRKIEFESKKERVEENLKKYNYKLDKISSIFYSAWINWIDKVKREDNFSKEKKQEWNSLTNNFLELNKEKKDNFRKFAKEVLEFFGLKEDGLEKINFNQELIDEKKENNKVVLEKISSLNEVLDSLNKKIIILNSNDENSNEILTQEIEIEILKLEKFLSTLSGEILKLESEEIRLNRDLGNYKKEESYAISFFGLNFVEGISILKNDFDGNEKEKNILEKITRTRILFENSKSLNSENTLKEYFDLKERTEFIQREINDLERTKEDLNKLISQITEKIEVKFREGLEKINKEFSVFFSTLFMGGKAEIFLVKIPIKKIEDNQLEEFELGIDLKVSLPNKKISGLGMLSGGERSLTSIALLFAMSSITPPPFIILDETDAALDEANSKRYGDMIERLAEHSQLILITHNRETMSRADLLYGVTMNYNGISKLLSVSFEKGQQYAK